jgi:EutQ-like cupin domain
LSGVLHFRQPQEDAVVSLSSASIDKPHESLPFRAHGHMDVVTIGDFTMGKGTFEPGWRWSTDVKPIAGTDSCQARHTGVCLSGAMTVRADDGSELTIGPGDVFVMEPGHDAWVVGDEPCLMFDTGVAAYAKPK